MLRATGVEDIRTIWIRRTFETSSVDDFWQLQTTFSSIDRKRLLTASDEALGRVRVDFLEGREAVLSLRERLV